MEVKSDGVDEEMKDDVDSVRGLLDRLKQEKERELLQQVKYGSSSVQENGISITDSKQNDVINELQKKQTSMVMNLKSVVKTKESPMFSSGDVTTQSDTGDNSKKRKQNSFLVEVQERAEVISKSARKAPETVVSSMGQNLEEDPDTEQFLKKIRATPSITSEGQTEKVEVRNQRSKSASEVDLSVVVSSSSQLNLEAQKSKIPLGRSGSLKGRRKPTAAARRKSLKSGVEWDDADAISEEDESMDEEETGLALSGGSFIIKDPPQMGSGSELRPRTRPKHKMKSQTVAGIALPGLAEVLSKKNVVKDNARPQLSAAEIVRAATEDKKNQAAKEERVEKEPEKPAWLVEAEARRKLHGQRRHNKAKQLEEMDKDKPVEDKPLNNVVLRPVAQKSEPVESNSDGNSIDLSSLAQRSEPVLGKPDSNGANTLHNVLLRPVRKPEPVPTKSEDDSDVSRSTLNFCLRPVSKPGPLATETGEDKDDDSVKPRNVFLRPIPKPEPVVYNDITEDSKGKFQPVRLKPLVHHMELNSPSSKVADSGTGPMALPTSSEEATSSKPVEMSSSGPTVVESEVAPMTTRTSSEVTASSSPPVKSVTQSFSYTATSSLLHEKDEVTAPDVTGQAKTSPEYHIVRSLSPITSEKPTITRSEPKVAEASSSHTSRPRGGSRVTISSNYVNAPLKMAPKPKPKATNRSKTVTVTASEVPDLSTARRTSVELIHARVERKSTRPTSTNIPISHAAPHNTKSHNAKSYGDLRGPRRGNDSRDRCETFNTSYRPTYTGDVLPQWKIDLIERKKNASALPDRPQPTHTSNSVVVPLWKKELAEKRKHRVEVNKVQTFNKENELKTSPEIPLWKKEFAERRKRREASPIRVQQDKIDRSPETPEWKQRLSNTRRTQPIVIPRGPPEDPPDQVPSFMKEFEKKKRTFPRGGNNASYV